MNNTCDLGCKIQETCHRLLFSCRELESCSPVVSNKPEFENVRWSTVSAKAIFFQDFNEFLSTLASRILPRQGSQPLIET